MKKYFLLSIIIYCLFCNIKLSAQNYNYIQSTGIDVTYDKTLHILFPSEITYVDLGSNDIIAKKADGSENVLRVKAAVKNFNPTNLSVITSDGIFYPFNVFYTDTPSQLNIEMLDILRDKQFYNHKIPVYFSTMGDTSPKMVNDIMTSIYNESNKTARNITSNKFKINYQLTDIYIHDHLIFLKTELRNLSNLPLDIDFIKIKVVDKKVAKRTVIQENILSEVQSYNEVKTIYPGTCEKTIFVINKITIPDDKLLVIELFEKNGSRNQQLIIKNKDLLNARSIKSLNYIKK